MFFFDEFSDNYGEVSRKSVWLPEVPDRLLLCMFVVVRCCFESVLCFPAFRSCDIPTAMCPRPGLSSCREELSGMFPSKLSDSKPSMRAIFRLRCAPGRNYRLVGKNLLECFRTSFLILNLPSVRYSGRDVFPVGIIILSGRNIRRSGHHRR